MNKRVVFGISDWPESFGEEFEIIDVREGETDQDAIQRAKELYDPELECIVKVIKA